MTVNIICDKDDLVGFIGLEADEGTIKPAGTPGLIEFGATVEREKLIELRDRLIEMFPIEEKSEDVPEWRRAGEWKEVKLEEAREGDYAEFDKDCTKNDRHVVCRVKKSHSGIVADMDNIIVGNISGLIWFIRNQNGSMGLCMSNLHIWRRLDPHRFDEPKDEGYYATQSGIILRNDGDGRRNWYLLVDQGRGRFDCANWTEVLDMLADSEFPLVKLTPEILRKAVTE